MFRNLIVTSLIMGCFGCQTIDQVFVKEGHIEQLGSSTVTTINDLETLLLEKGKRSEINIQENTQHLKGYGVDSAVAVFELPSNYKIFQLKIQAFYDSKVFAPSALVIDDKGNVLSRVPNAKFEYKPGDLFQTYRQESELRVSPIIPDSPIYVILYTTESDAIGRSRIVVKKDRVTEEEVVVPHSDTGRVAVEFDALDKSDTVVLASDNGLEVKTLEYNTNRVESLFDELRKTISQGNTQKALKLVDQIQKL